jgi:hypothetical protein
VSPTIHDDDNADNDDNALARSVVAGTPSVAVVITPLGGGGKPFMFLSHGLIGCCNMAYYQD